MSETMALRTQILDNLRALEYPNLKDRHFVLIWDGKGEYTVSLDDRHVSRESDYYGKGPTPEEAYDNMLKQTAFYLYAGYHRKNLVEASRSEIMALRTQILDNIQTLHLDLKPDSRFILTCSNDDEPEAWTVVLRLPAEARPGQYSQYYEHGKGESPEAAYKDLLKNTAWELHDLDYSWN
ncbi:hypothetical protein KCU98_g7819, partial [Aureobasidium melanogenum]